MLLCLQQRGRACFPAFQMLLQQVLQAGPASTRGTGQGWIQTLPAWGELGNAAGGGSVHTQGAEPRNGFLFFRVTHSRCPQVPSLHLTLPVRGAWPTSAPLCPAFVGAGGATPLSLSAGSPQIRVTGRSLCWLSPQRADEAGKPAPPRPSPLGLILTLQPGGPGPRREDGVPLPELQGIL